MNRPALWRDIRAGLIVLAVGIAVEWVAIPAVMQVILDMPR